MTKEETIDELISSLLNQKDLNEIVECANCKKKIKYGDSYAYTHRKEYVFYDENWCADCYFKEVK